ncbi:hypothetical protein CYMTET_35171, partial [Cymbomonas tetramitiformis]
SPSHRAPAVPVPLLPLESFLSGVATGRAGEVECREYRRSVMAAMPHYWARREDTQMRLAHFGKSRKPKSQRPAVKSASQPAASVAKPRSQPALATSNKMVAAVEHAVVAASKGRHEKPSKRTRHAPTSSFQDNVIVAHLKEGIEAVQLYTGRTVCKLLLPPDSVHADVNGDSVLDHIQAHGWHPQNPEDGSGVRIPRCWATVTSGIGREQLFNGSICRTNMGHEGSVSRSGRGESHSPLEVAPPALMPAADTYLPGSKAVKRRGATSDLVFLNSRGEVTMYAIDGTKRWQLQVHTTWHRSGYDGEEDVAPALVTFAPRVGGRVEAILASGAQIAAVISPTGHKLQKIALPNVPTSPPRLVDLNGDGLNDLLIPVQGGFYVFLQRAQSGQLPFTAMLGILIVAMAMVYFTQQQPGGDARGSKPQRSTD